LVLFMNIGSVDPQLSDSFLLIVSVYSQNLLISNSSTVPKG